MYTRKITSHLMIIFIFTLIETSQAEFTTFAINAGRLNSSVLLLHHNQRSITSCIMKCMDHTKCKMVNFNDGSHQCELIGQPVGDIETVNDPDWLNYRIPQEQIKSKTKCQDCPCGHGYEYCEDIEEDPGYRCICKESYIGARCTVKEKVNKLILIGKEEPLTENNLIATLDTMEKGYKVSFEVKPTSASTSYRSVIHFTTGEEGATYGSRTPAIWFRYGQILFCSAVNDDLNYCYFSEIVPIDNWISVQISQTMQMNNYMYNITINGKVINTVINNNPREFRNVQMFASNPWIDAQLGFIRNLTLSLGEN